MRHEMHEVKRTMEEFFLLRKHLLRAYPYVIVPALPQRFKPTKIQSTRIRVGRFIASLMRNDLFKADRLLLFFLTEPDSQVAAINRELKRAPTDFGPFNIFTAEGQINTRMTQIGADASASLENFIKQHKSIMEGILKETALVRDQTKGLAEVFGRLQMIMIELDVLNRQEVNNDDDYHITQVG